MSDGMSKTELSFQNRVVQLILGAIGVIILGAASTYIGAKLTEPDPKVTQSRRLDNIENRVGNLENAIKNQQQQINARPTSDVLDEKFGRIHDSISTINGRMVLNANNIQENREAIQHYLYQKKSSYKIKKKHSGSINTSFDLGSPNYPKIPDGYELNNVVAYSKQNYVSDTPFLTVAYALR